MNFGFLRKGNRELLVDLSYPNDILGYIQSLQVVSERKTNDFVIGRGVITWNRWYFDPNKLEVAKPYMAGLLADMGIRESTNIKLIDLLSREDGSEWNKLRNEKDFLCIDALLACFSACGFVINDEYTEKEHAARMNEKLANAISQYHRVHYPNDKDWLRLLREAFERMHYDVDAEEIKKYSGGTEMS